LQHHKILTTQELKFAGTLSPALLNLPHQGQAAFRPSLVWGIFSGVAAWQPRYAAPIAMEVAAALVVSQFKSLMLCKTALCFWKLDGHNHKRMHHELPESLHSSAVKLHRAALAQWLTVHACCAMVWVQRTAPRGKPIQFKGIRSSRDGNLVPFDYPQNLSLLTGLQDTARFGVSKHSTFLHTCLPVVAAYGRDALLQDKRHALLNNWNWQQVGLQSSCDRQAFMHDAHLHGDFPL
jgi:hypothetical protein